jgi:hypothetical protein
MRTRSSNSTHFSFHSHMWNHACDDWPWSPHATWSSSSPSPITHHPLSQHCLLAWCIMSRVSCSLEHHDSSRSSTSTGGDMIMHMIEYHAPSASSTFLLHRNSAHTKRKWNHAHGQWWRTTPVTQVSFPKGGDMYIILIASMLGLEPTLVVASQSLTTSCIITRYIIKSQWWPNTQLAASASVLLLLVTGEIPSVHHV